MGFACITLGGLFRPDLLLSVMTVLHEMDSRGNWSFDPCMVPPGRDVAPVGRSCFSSGTKVIRVDSRKFKAKLGSLSVAQIFKREHSWKWIERERVKLMLNDTYKKVKWEVASEKMGAAGSSLSSNRRNCIIGGWRHMCSKTNTCASFMYQALCWGLHGLYCTESSLKGLIKQTMLHSFSI